MNIHKKHLRILLPEPKDHFKNIFMNLMLYVLISRMSEFHNFPGRNTDLGMVQSTLYFHALLTFDEEKGLTTRMITYISSQAILNYKLNMMKIS